MAMNRLMQANLINKHTKNVRLQLLASEERLFICETAVIGTCVRTAGSRSVFFSTSHSA